MADCEYCGEPGATLDLYPREPRAPILVHPRCYEELAQTDKKLVPLHLHPDFDPEAW
jgi:hypothetical protein